ncbi:hypothetical protein HDU93_009425 [Gonapodya sp. JEL0774]|nr:hypothetical protein HDU93_009425 [Gonapodya sp. JEL0774]
MAASSLHGNLAINITAVVPVEGDSARVLAAPSTLTADPSTFTGRSGQQGSSVKRASSDNRRGPAGIPALESDIELAVRFLSSDGKTITSDDINKKLLPFFPYLTSREMKALGLLGSSAYSEGVGTDGDPSDSTMKPSNRSIDARGVNSANRRGPGNTQTVDSLRQLLCKKQSFGTTPLVLGSQNRGTYEEALEVCGKKPVLDSRGIKDEIERCSLV